MTMNLMLIGPPGGGKGTQAARLREEFELTHLATGDLLRRHRAEGTALGREAAEYMSSGRLVPDALVTSMLIAALEEAPEQGSCSTASRALCRRPTRSPTRSRRPAGR